MYKLPSYKPLVKLVKEWQERLRLTDYHIGVRWVSIDGMPTEGALGAIAVNTEYKSASIRFLMPECYAGLGGTTYSVAELEKTVIHELLHIYFHGLKISRKLTELEEQALNIIAEALYNAKYRINNT